MGTQEHSTKQATPSSEGQGQATTRRCAPVFAARVAREAAFRAVRARRGAGCRLRHKPDMRIQIQNRDISRQTAHVTQAGTESTRRGAESEMGRAKRDLLSISFGQHRRNPDKEQRHATTSQNRDGFKRVKGKRSYPELAELARHTRRLACTASHKHPKHKNKVIGCTPHETKQAGNGQRTGACRVGTGGALRIRNSEAQDQRMHQQNRRPAARTEARVHFKGKRRDNRGGSNNCNGAKLSKTQRRGQPANRHTESHKNTRNTDLGALRRGGSVRNRSLQSRTQTISATRSAIAWGTRKESSAARTQESS